MKTRVAVISVLHLMRRQLEVALVPVGYETHVYDSIVEFKKAFARLRHSVVVMDADGAADEWRALMRFIHECQKCVAVILVTSNISLELTKDAIKRGVASIILKPFIPREHLKKIVNAVDSFLGIKAKRKKPRIYPPPEEKAEITYPMPGTRLMTHQVENISEDGAQLVVESAAPGFYIGRKIDNAVLSLGDSRLTVQFEVVSSNNGKVGIRFLELDLKGSLRKHIQNYIDEFLKSTAAPGETGW